MLSKNRYLISSPSQLKRSKVFQDLFEHHRLFAKENAEQIEYSFLCPAIRQITFSDNVAVINYGDGDCDNEVTIMLNSETFTKTVESRGGK